MQPLNWPEPFLKWPGGKRALSTAIASHLPSTFGRYFEPFAGSAALFFFLRPRSAMLLDVNSDLVDVYRNVRDSVDLVIDRLRALKIREDEYYRIRAWRPTSSIAKAVRFLYLNRTAFNGIYRVNRRGEFNVPFGCKPSTVLCDEPNLRRASNLLQSVALECGDFEQAFANSKQGDLVYADPPYTTMHDKNGFRRYNESIFSWSDQERLAKAARDAASRGVHVVVSNAHHADISALYPDFKQAVLTRPSCIAGSANARKQVSEFLLIATRNARR